MSSGLDIKVYLPLSPLHKRAHDCRTFCCLGQMAGAMPAGALQFMAYESSKAQVLSLLALLVQTYKC